MDYMVKSAAWEGMDITTLEECYLIRRTLPDTGEVHDFYAYLLGGDTTALEAGTAVLQAGTDGRYSVISQDLYRELETCFP